MSEQNSQKIAVVGVGAVGATVAYAILLKNFASEVILVDINEAKVDGEVMDLNDALSFVETKKIKRGTYKDVADADIIVLTAGTPQKVGAKRTDLLDKNREIMKSIFDQIGPIKQTAIILVVSNPVDIMTYMVQELSGLPVNQVIGTGTALDTARLKTELSLKLGVNPHSIHGFILGEHGDSEFVAWSTVMVGGAKVKETLSPEKMTEIENKVRQDAYEIIEKKGSTYYGIATVVSDFVEAIMVDKDKIMTASARLKDWNGVSDVCLGVPVVINRQGIKEVWPLELEDGEKERFQKSAETIKEFLVN